MKVTVATFVRDRFGHVKLCTEWLHRSAEVDGFQFKFVAFDDRSDDIRIEPYLQTSYHQVETPPLGKTPDERIGLARKAAVDLFLATPDGDYLLLLDSDIITTKSAIAEAVNDYEMLSELNLVGGATLAPLGHIESSFIHNGACFASLSLTGDAHMLFKRKHLELVGNHFGDQHKGFADTQIQAIQEHGRIYWSRLHPTYSVQHIGFGEGGTTIYNDVKIKPHWVTRPYWTQFPPRDIVKVPGFDVLHYVQLVNTVGGERAPLHYLETKGVYV